jgi:hypothetical protein
MIISNLTTSSVYTNCKPVHRIRKFNGDCKLKDAFLQSWIKFGRSLHCPLVCSKFVYELFWGIEFLPLSYYHEKEKASISIEMKTTANHCPRHRYEVKHR